MGRDTEEPRFRAGEVVYLVSGGPPMAVIEHFRHESDEDYDYVACCWHWRGKVGNERLVPGVLTRKATPSPMGPVGGATRGDTSQTSTVSDHQPSGENF